MRKNTDSNRFCEDKIIDFFGEVFLGILIGVITAWVN